MREPGPCRGPCRQLPANCKLSVAPGLWTRLGDSFDSPLPTLPTSVQQHNSNPAGTLPLDQESKSRGPLSSPPS